MAKNPACLNIAVLGAGRMGHELMSAIASDDALRLAGVWARKKVKLDEEIVVSDDLPAVLSASDHR